MPQYRMTVFFNQSVLGWSETYWSRGLVSPATMASLITQYCDQRTSFMFNNQEVVGVRCAEIEASGIAGTVKRKSFFLTPGNWLFPGTNSQILIPSRGKLVLAGARNPDQVRAAIQLRLTYDVGFTTTRYLAGISDQVTFTEPGSVNFNGDPSWHSAYQAYLTHLETVWAIRARTNISIDPEIDVEDLTNASVGPSNLGVIVSTGVGPSLLMSKKVQLKGFRPCHRHVASINGTYRLASINTTQIPGKIIYYLRGTEGATAGDYKTLGTIQQVNYVTQSIQSAYAIRVGIHKRGGPSTSPRGRRLTRATLPC